MTRARGARLLRATLLLGALLGACVGCSLVQQNRRNQADATSCQGGDAAACLRQGDLWRGYRDGPNRESDALKRSLDAYQRACTGGLADGCLRVVELYTTDAALVGESARGQPFALRACELGNAAGCALAAGLEPSGAKRIVMVQQICERDIGACLSMVDLLADQPEAAYPLALRTCTADATQCQAATRFAHGEGERGELLGRACSAGQTQQCVDAARALDSTGAREPALQLLRRGCRGKDRASCDQLGTMLATPAGS